MWYSSQLQDYLLDTFKRDVWSEELLPNLHKVIINTIKAVQDKLEPQKSAMELVGFDIMLDDAFNPWLLEVNSSPTMEYSTVSSH